MPWQELRGAAHSPVGLQGHWQWERHWRMVAHRLGVPQSAQALLLLELALLLAEASRHSVRRPQALR
eukprot:scaffold620_cov282-Pinguiococcus_pyrenoidosus.AAC.10